MMRSSVMTVLFVVTMLCQNSFSYSQSGNPGDISNEFPSGIEPKPYKVLTSGKQVTIRSERTIKHVMLWTASGHRVLEQKEINSLQFTFKITVNENIFF